MLDVMQIFGRAGRPQYDVRGDATILTTHDQLSRYLSMLMHELPIESRFIESLPDNLNAEVRRMGGKGRGWVTFRATAFVVRSTAIGIV